MTKRKTWIKVKRGMLEPKHRIKLGIRVWLYLHILDRADWETGIVLDWVDESEAAVLALPLNTMRRQRQRLEKDGYISAEKGQYSQRITIHNWTDPRKYDGIEINQSTQESTPSDKAQSTQPRSAQLKPLSESASESPSESASDYTAHSDPSLDSHNTNHKPQKKKTSDRPAAVELCKRIIFRYPHKSLWKTIDRNVGNELVDLLRWGRIMRKWRLSNFNITNYKGMLENFNRDRKHDDNTDYMSDKNRRKYLEGWFDG